VPLQPDTYERIEQSRLAGETDSDVVLRIMTLYNSNGRKN
jgi:hypothetical protein